MFKAIRHAASRSWRLLLGRDNCGRCNGSNGVRGSETVVDGIVTCDYCHMLILAQPPLRDGKYGLWV